MRIKTSIFLLLIAGLLMGCAHTNQPKGKGAVADSPAGRQADSNEDTGSLGAFIYSRHHKGTKK